MSWSDTKKRLARSVVGTFGQGVTFKPKSGGEFPIKAVVDRSWVEVQFGDGVPVSSLRTVADVNRDDLPTDPEEGDKLTIDGADFTIIDARSDGGRMLELVLNK